MYALSGLSGLSGVVGGSSGSLLANIDYPVNASNKSKFAVAGSGERVVYDYAGATLRLVRATPLETVDYTPGSDGRLNKAAILSWAGASDVTLSGVFNQINGAFITANNVTIITGGAFVRTLDMDKNKTTGALSSTGEGCVGIPLNGTSSYLELTSSGITMASGLELHYMGCHNTRKVASGAVATDPFSGNATSEIPISYGVSATNMIFDRVCAGAYLNFGDRNGSGASGTDQWIYGGISNERYPRYAIRVNTITCNNSYLRRYQYGNKEVEVATSVGNQTANAAMTNGTLRIGRGYGTDTTWANMTIGAFFASTDLTDVERWDLHDRLTVLASHNYASSLANAADPWDEIIDWRDANASTGVVAGRKGKLTIQLNMGAGKTWSFGYSVNGRTGLRSPDIFNNNNWFEATTNYFWNVQGLSVGEWCYTERAAIQDYWAFAKTVDANHMASGTMPLCMGWDHYAQRVICDVDDALDTNDVSGAYGFNDQVGGNGSQHRVKYGHKQGNTDWNFPATATASVTLRSLYGSRVINNGDVVTSANLKSWCNIDAPTPELVQCDRSSYAGYFLAGANRLCETLFKLTPNPLYDYAGNQAARDPYMKKATTEMWCGSGTGTPVGQTDSGIGISPGSMNHVHMDNSYKIRSSQYQSGGANFQGTKFLTLFATTPLTDAQLKRWSLNKYKVFTEGW